MAALLCVSQSVYSRIENGSRPLSMRALGRVAEQSGISIHTLILAHLLLDKHLAAIERAPADSAQASILRLAETYRSRFPIKVKDGAALALLYENGPENGDHGRLRW